MALSVGELVAVIVESKLEFVLSKVLPGVLSTVISRVLSGVISMVGLMVSVETEIVGPDVAKALGDEVANSVGTVVLINSSSKSLSSMLEFVAFAVGKSVAFDMFKSCGNEEEFVKLDDGVIVGTLPTPTSIAGASVVGLLLPLSRKTVGTALGLGVNVGLLVEGSKLTGEALGLPGETVGSIVGPAVGLNVGGKVGPLEGKPVGPTVGPDVGAWLTGDALGLPGETVGPDVGDPVGAPDVGLSVGAEAVAPVVGPMDEETDVGPEVEPLEGA